MANLTKSQKITLLSDIIELADIAAAKDIGTAAYVAQHAATTLGVKLADAHKVLSADTATKLDQLMADTGH